MEKSRLNDLDYHVWHPWTDMNDPAMAYRHEYFTSASGTEIMSSDGVTYFDASSGLWNVNLGHGRSDIVDAIAESLRRMTFQSLINTPSKLANELAVELRSIVPDNLTKAMFHCTGTSATEGALLTVRQLFKRRGKTRKTGIIALERGFHGSSYLMTAVSGLQDDRTFFEPLPPEIYHIPAPLNSYEADRSLDELQRLISELGNDRLQSLIVEPVMGVEGAFPLPASWLRQATDMCRDADIIVIADEVATGLGRTGQWVAWPKEIHIGVLVLGKGLCAGYMPLAATLYDQTIFDDFFSNKSSGPLRFGSTMDGAPAALAAALATVRLLKDLDTPSVVTRTRQLIDEPLNKLLAIPIVKKVQGLGLMVGICLCDPTDNTKPIPQGMLDLAVTKIRKKGILLDPEGNSCILFYPPLISTEEQLGQAIEIIHTALVETYVQTNCGAKTL